MSQTCMHLLLIAQSQYFDPGWILLLTATQVTFGTTMLWHYLPFFLLRNAFHSSSSIKAMVKFHFILTNHRLKVQLVHIHLFTLWYLDGSMVLCISITQCHS